jgi:hypothetical protein
LTHDTQTRIRMAHPSLIGGYVTQFGLSPIGMGIFDFLEVNVFSLLLMGLMLGCLKRGIRTGRPVLCGFDMLLYLSTQLQQWNHKLGYKLVQQPDHKNINCQVDKLQHVSKVTKNAGHI